MKYPLLVAALVAITLSACGKKDDTPASLPAPAFAPSLNTPPASVGEVTLPASAPAAGLQPSSPPVEDKAAR